MYTIMNQQLWEYDKMVSQDNTANILNEREKLYAAYTANSSDLCYR